MAEEKKEVKKEAEPEPEPEPKPELLNRTYIDGDGNKYYWTKKSGMTEPVKVYK